MKLESVVPILQEMWQSRVFQDSFSVTDDQVGFVAHQMEGVAEEYIKEADRCFAEGMLGAEAHQAQKLVRGLAVTAVGFGSGLSAGEIDDVPRLSQLATLIGVTGWGNRLCDQGDQAMAFAISRLCGIEVSVPIELKQLVETRLKGLKHIERLIHGLAVSDEDEHHMLRASRDELMKHEVLAHDLSMDYQGADDKNAFLARHAGRIATTLTTTGALPSAITPLYGVYRHHYELPSLKEVYAVQAIIDFLRVANTFIRVFDDLGDRAIDREATSLNLFNQAHPTLIEAFCEQAAITDKDHVKKLVKAFMGRANERERTQEIAEFFLKHIREYVSNLPPEITGHKYVRLGKCGIEAGHANRKGGF